MSKQKNCILQFPQKALDLHELTQETLERELFLQKQIMESIPDFKKILEHADETQKNVFEDIKKSVQEKHWRSENEQHES